MSKKILLPANRRYHRTINSRELKNNLRALKKNPRSLGINPRKMIQTSIYDALEEKTT